MTDAEATYGALDFLSDDFHLLGENLEWGSPEEVMRSARRQLRDGEIIEAEYATNRTLQLPLVVTGDNNLRLSENEAKLTIEARKPRNEFRFKWPGLNTPVSVYDTFHALSLDPVHDDVARLRDRPHQMYMLTLSALPFPKSAAQVSHTFTYPDLGATLQVPVGGSVRTTADIELIADAGGPLGDVMVLTWPEWRTGFSPHVMDYLTGTQYQIPATQLREGAYAASLAGIEWDPLGGYSENGTIAELANATYSVVASTSISGRMADRGQGIASIGTLHLPIAPVAPTSDLEVRLSKWHDTGGSAVGTPFLIPLDSNMTYLADVERSRLWIKAPSLDYPDGAMFVGDEADESDAYGYLGSSITLGEAHELAPTSSSLYVWSSNGAGALESVTVRYHKRWHTWAAE